MSDARTAQLAAFCDWVRQNTTGDEKGEAQIYLDRLLRAFGHGGVKEAGAQLATALERDRDERRMLAFHNNHLTHWTEMTNPNFARTP